VSHDKSIVIKIDPLYDKIENISAPSDTIALTTNHDTNLIAEVCDERYDSGQKLLPRR